MRPDPGAALRVGRRAGGTVFTALAAVGDARMRPSRSPSQAAARFGAAARAVCDLHGVAVTRHGELPGEPFVLVANHVSWLDAIVLGQLVPCMPIAKGEVAGWPVIGRGADALGVTFVDRADPRSGARALRRALRALADGVTVLNFPEGTTTDGAQLLPFKRGIFGAARLAGVPIVPVAVRYAMPDVAWTGGDAFVPHYARIAARPCIEAELRVGEPIIPTARDAARGLANLARRQLATLLDLPTRIHEPAARLRVPAPRPDAVLPPAARRLRAV